MGAGAAGSFDLLYRHRGRQHPRQHGGRADLPKQQESNTERLADDSEGPSRGPSLSAAKEVGSDTPPTLSGVASSVAANCDVADRVCAESEMLVADPARPASLSVRAFYRLGGLSTARVSPCSASVEARLGQQMFQDPLDLPLTTLGRPGAPTSAAGACRASPYAASTLPGEASLEFSLLPPAMAAAVAEEAAAEEAAAEAAAEEVAEARVRQAEAEVAQEARGQHM